MWRHARWFDFIVADCGDTSNKASQATSSHGKILWKARRSFQSKRPEIFYISCINDKFCSRSNNFLLKNDSHCRWAFSAPVLLLVARLGDYRRVAPPAGPVASQRHASLDKNLLRFILYKTAIHSISFATSDVLISDLMFSEEFMMFDVLATNLMLTELLFLFFTFSLIQNENKLDWWFLHFVHQSLILMYIWLSFPNWGNYLQCVENNISVTLDRLTHLITTLRSISYSTRVIALW